VVRKNI